MILIYAILGTPVHAGANSDLIHSYELVPANPAPNTPFELRIVYDNALLIDGNDTSVTIDGSDVVVAVGFIFNICPPLQPCPPELTGEIPIPGLPTGSYHMHIMDSDGTPPFDASIDFIVGSAPPAAIPTLSESMMAMLFLLLVVGGTLAMRSARKVCGSV